MPSNSLQLILGLEDYGMWLRKSTLYVCLLTGSAMALAMAGKSSGQNSSNATEAPSGYDNQPNGLTDTATFTMDRGKIAH